VELNEVVSHTPLNVEVSKLKGLKIFALQVFFTCRTKHKQAAVGEERLTAARKRNTGKKSRDWRSSKLNSPKTDSFLSVALPV